MNSHQLDATFSALADPTRRAILARLASGEASVNELMTPFSISQPAISRHLKVLERAGLVTTAADGRQRIRQLNARPLSEANQWLEEYRQFWAASFDRLEILLAQMQAPKAKKRKS
jgi:DNA-binding transcriptional ArsR family regulator